MPALRIATQNLGKLREFQQLLLPHFHCIAADTRAPQVIEDGMTYPENAFKKAKAFFTVYQAPVLADDSGLEIDVLAGEPGVLSARFGGETISWDERFQILYKRLAPFSEKDWTARFRCVLCLFWGQKEPLFFEGVTEGRIQKVPKGTRGFGYDPIFFSTDLQKTFSEASDDEKAQVSHRGRAVRLLLNWFQKNPHKLT